jgi:hypothetical protein
LNKTNEDDKANIPGLSTSPAYNPAALVVEQIHARKALEKIKAQYDAKMKVQ